MASNEERALQAVVQAGPVGIPHTELKDLLKLHMDGATVSQVLRTLVNEQKIGFTKNQAGEYSVVKKESLPEKLAIILEALKSYGASGGDSALVSQKTKMPKTEVTKGIQQLIQRGDVRETRSITNRAKKMFVLAEFERSVEVTGGAFYNEQRELDVRFVDTVRSGLFNFIKSRGGAAVNSVDVKQHMDAEGLPKQLSLADVERALGSLVLDGILSRVGAAESQRYILSAGSAARNRIGGAGAAGGAANAQYTTATFVESQRETFRTTPCLSCPQLLTCNIGSKGVVNTNTCPYLEQWLTPISGTGGSSTSGSPKTGGGGMSRTTTTGPVE